MADSQVEKLKNKVRELETKLKDIEQALTLVVETTATTVTALSTQLLGVIQVVLAKKVCTPAEMQESLKCANDLDQLLHLYKSNVPPKKGDDVRSN